MDTSKQLSALLLTCLLSIPSFSPILALACVTCQPQCKVKSRKPEGIPVVYPPVLEQPPLTISPITVPQVGGTYPQKVPGHYPRLGPPVTCPADLVKLGLCLNLLGGLVDVKLGDPAANMCCLLLEGLLELLAAVCLRTTIKLKLLSLDVYVPLSLKVLAVWGLTSRIRLHLGLPAPV